MQLLDHIARFILGFLGYFITGEKGSNNINIISDCWRKGNVKTCHFPTINLLENNLSFNVRRSDDLLSHDEDEDLKLLDRQSRSGLRFSTTTTLLSDSTMRTVVCEKVDAGIPGVFHYECEGDALEANFIQREDETGTLRTYGSLLMGKEVCHIAPNLHGIDEITCNLDSSFEPEVDIDDDEEGDSEEVERHRELKYQEKFGHVKFGMVESAQQNLDQRRLNTDDGSIIDVMVVWTRLSECLHSNLSSSCTPNATTENKMRALIALAMEETNVAFSFSGVRTQLRLVHAYRHDNYEEPTSNAFVTIMRDVVGLDDGKLDDVHAKRILYGADVVHVIGGSAGACGVAHVGPGKSRMFSLSRFSCTSGHYSFGVSFPTLHALMK